MLLLLLRGRAAVALERGRRVVQGAGLARRRPGGVRGRGRQLWRRGGGRGGRLLLAFSGKLRRRRRLRRLRVLLFSVLLLRLTSMINDVRIVKTLALPPSRRLALAVMLVPLLLLLGGISIGFLA